MTDPLARALASAPKPRAAITAANALDWQKYSPHRPHPQQEKFLALDTLDALFGGAAGGGKSDALLMAALQYVHVPGYAAILFRRTYQDLALPGAIMDRSHEWLSNTDAEWNGNDKRWTFPSGATLSFGYLDKERHRFRYASAEFQFVGLDELTQFPEKWARFLFSRLRKPKKLPDAPEGVISLADVPLRYRGATNPGALGHEWVRRRYIAAHDPKRPFIPSKLVDNPSVDAESYEQSLAELDATTRKQLLEGLWVRDSEGLVYASFDQTRNVVKLPEDGKPFDFHVLALDFGFTNATAFAVLAWRANERRVHVLRSWKVRKKTPSEIGEMCRALEVAYKFDHIVGDVGGLGKGYAEEARKRFRVPIEPAEKRNKRGYINLLNGAFESGELVLVAGENEALETELLELPWDEDRSEEAAGFDNHICDATLYGWRRCSAYTEEDKADEPAKGTTEWEAAEEARAVERHDTGKTKEWWERNVDDSWYDDRE